LPAVAFDQSKRSAISELECPSVGVEKLDVAFGPVGDEPAVSEGVQAPSGTYAGSGADVVFG
jgi:hypothetical protein